MQPGHPQEPRKTSMTRQNRSWFSRYLGIRTAAFLVLVVGGMELCASDEELDAGKRFELYIRPILSAKCVACHGESKQEGGLRLDSLPEMLEGGESGPAIAKGKPEESLLVEAIKYESFEMPPDGRLSEEEILRMQAWVADGAVWPEHQPPIRTASKRITDEDRQWWAFRPLFKPTVPSIRHANGSHNPIDQFVYARLHQREMRPAPRANDVTLVRRLYFDLIGLPPSPAQIDEYLAEDVATRWERLIDKLLANPAYGEHWARYWLDLVRYAESDGWNQDAYRPHIWHYRDYVVRALNDDKPYPEFVQQQLAGDQLPGDDPDNLAATGFLRLGIYEYNQRDAESHWKDVIDEITDVTGDVFLGLGMACTRCHDHKFDPLLRRDYYQLRAFFEPLIWCDDDYYASDADLADYEQKLETWKEATSEVRGQIDALLQPYRNRKWASTVDKFPLNIQACFNKPEHERTSWEHQMAYLIGRQFEEEGGGPLGALSKEDKEKHKLLKEELSEWNNLKPTAPPRLMTAIEYAGAISPTLIPGNISGPPIAPGFPEVMSELTMSVGSGVSTHEAPAGRRARLAAWICHPDNPLTTRVIVNRVWQHHFGQGITATPNDLGRLGKLPSHPELLDWLAVSFVENGWSFKRLHKLILSSATWQQSSRHPDQEMYERQDPEELLLWRARIRRLGAEQIRDAMLSVAGNLQVQVGGPSVDRKSTRRSLYLKSLRNRPDEFMHTFDAANGLKSTAERNRTTTSLQALLMMNGPFCLQQADMFAKRLEQRTSPNVKEMLRFAFRLAWGRAPTDAELQQAVSFVGDAATANDKVAVRCRITDFCHALLNSNEFIYLD
jgi:mono/diheme cytochrome c family protein